MKPTYSQRQGQFLAYIHQYSILNGCAPAEADIPAVFSDYAAKRTFDGSHTGEAWLHSASAWTGAQHHPDRFTRIVASLETRPTQRIETMTKTNKQPGGWSEIDSIRTLHETLKSEYGSDDRHLTEGETGNRLS